MDLTSSACGLRGNMPLQNSQLFKCWALFFRSGESQGSELIPDNSMQRRMPASARTPKGAISGTVKQQNIAQLTGNLFGVMSTGV